MTSNATRELLEAAIIGYQTKIAEMQQRITGIRMRLYGHLSASSHPKPAKPRKRTMSAAAKRKLSLAAKRRWAKLRRQHPKAKTLGG